ncbi:MAG: 30S ribosomal protein S21 [Bacteroidaceae bacterium]|nr:30S ribosomal protein S21 [Bacteroidaceae bacterium]
MIIVPVKDGENIERALKKFKRKSEKTGVIKEVRTRKQFDKPSVLKRIKMQHAVYVNKLHQEEEQ